MKPDAMASVGAEAVAAEVRSHAAVATVAGECWLTDDDVDEWYPDIRDEPHYVSMVRYLTGGPMALIHVLAPDAFATAARVKRTIRATWGSGELRNWVHSPDSPADRDSECELFGPRLRHYAVDPGWGRRPVRGL